MSSDTKVSFASKMSREILPIIYRVDPVMDQYRYLGRSESFFLIGDRKFYKL